MLYRCVGLLTAVFSFILTSRIQSLTTSTRSLASLACCFLDRCSSG